MAKHNSYSFTRHNLNKLTAKKYLRRPTILTAEVEYTNKCKSCGEDCPSTVNECLTCAMGFGPDKGEK